MLKHIFNERMLFDRNEQGPQLIFLTKCRGRLYHVKIKFLTRLSYNTNNPNNFGYQVGRGAESTGVVRRTYLMQWPIIPCYFIMSVLPHMNTIYNRHCIPIGST